MDNLKGFISGLSTGEVMLLTLFLSIVIESITAFLRFGLGLNADKMTPFVSRLTFGIRVHHGYIGAILLFTAWIVREPVYIHNFALILGGSLAIFDFIHHVLVLCPITGSPQFHLKYPRQEESKR